jgi:hypothetical protein
MGARVRYISSTGDEGTSSHRTARTGLASATVYVGNPDGERPDGHGPSITLLVHADGTVQVLSQARDDDTPHIMLAGHVDHLGDAA